MKKKRSPTGGEEKRQRTLHEAAMKLAGSIHGNDPNRAQNARAEVQARIARRHGRSPSTGLLVSTGPKLGEESELFKKLKR
jgi:hypothetical protein